MLAILAAMSEIPRWVLLPLAGVVAAVILVIWKKGGG
jgi:hypothetical protein